MFAMGYHPSDPWLGAADALRQSRRAKAAKSVAASQNAITHRHSMAPEWRSGSMPQTPSIQSRHITVTTARMAAIEATAVSTQKTEMRLYFTEFPRFLLNFPDITSIYPVGPQTPSKFISHAAVGINPIFDDDVLSITYRRSPASH
jgi:hypothetical protein